MGSDYDDELWSAVPDEPDPPPDHLVRFVRALPPAGDALDLGAGDGRLGADIRADRLTVADVSAVALERARRRLPEVRAVELSPDAPLPLPDASFDLVLSAETIEHVRDVQRFLSEVRRVLRPGGTFALTTPIHGRRTGLRVLLFGLESVIDPLSPHIRHFTRTSLEALLDALGFEVVSARRRGGTLLVTATR
jgi:SAM-dependent methyltransferase